MPKAKPHHDQLGFTFETPIPANRPAGLAGLEQRVCRMVGTILNGDSRPREVIAAEMSVLLDEEVSRAMLDAYASPARDGHKVPLSRFWALLQVTGRHDLLDLLTREIGVATLLGDEVHTARIGQIARKMKQLQAEMRELQRTAPLIRGGIDGKPGR